MGCVGGRDGMDICKRDDGEKDWERLYMYEKSRGVCGRTRLDSAAAGIVAMRCVRGATCRVIHTLIDVGAAGRQNRKNLPCSAVKVGDNRSYLIYPAMMVIRRSLLLALEGSSPKGKDPNKSYLSI